MANGENGTDILPQDRPKAIAPAPAHEGGPDSHSSLPLMAYACQTCTRRKVKCDKLSPICSTCRRGKLECFYQAPAPRRRKRKFSGDVHDRLRSYERILQEHGLLPGEAEEPALPEDNISPPNDTPAISIRINEPETARIGKLVTGSGKSRYIDSNLWRALDDDDLQQLSEDVDEDDAGHVVPKGQIARDPLSGALFGETCSLQEYHPDYETAKKLWLAYTTNVEPICRILHVPSTGVLLDEAARDPRNLSKTTECVLFAIYHFAVVSMPEEDCLSVFREPSSSILPRYRSAICQALVNASFLRTVEMPVLQAYTLFLLAVRRHYDPSTFWILTGVAFRIAQRMGLHRDGEILGLPPFEMQMRRRLFWQLLPLDGIAAQISGTGITQGADTWDTKQPLNLNENQIWPGMTHQPEEQVGATDMIFCIARAEVGKFHTKAKSSLRSTVSMGSGESIRAHEADAMDKQIDEMEDLLERKVVRYCDVVEPLHFVTICMARGAMSVIRLRLKLAMTKHEPMSDAQMREVQRLSLKVLDYDTATCTNQGLRKFMWHVGAIFQHSALACAMASLRRPGLLSDAEVTSTWRKIEQVYINHPELISQKRALHTTVRRLTLKAWDHSSQAAGMDSEPSFITTLRTLHPSTTAKARRIDEAPSTSLTDDSASVNGTSPETDGIFNDLQGEGFSLEPDYTLDTADWMYWDRLMQDFQSKPLEAP